MVVRRDENGLETVCDYETSDTEQGGGKDGRRSRHDQGSEERLTRLEMAGGALASLHIMWGLREDGI